MTALPAPVPRSPRSPFDRVGSIALIWAAVFIVTAAGLILLIG